MKRGIRRPVQAGLAAAGIATAAPAWALCLKPLCACTVATTSMSFGSINPLGPPVDSTGTVRVTCGGVAGLLIPYRVDIGPGHGGQITARRMSSGAHTLNYGVYQDAGRATVWGDPGAGTPLNANILLNVLGWAPTAVHTVYGRIPSGQVGTVPGVYSDTLTVTVTYY